MSNQVSGRLLKLEAFVGEIPESGSGWVDITAYNRTGFQFTPTESSRTANNEGRINTDPTGFMRGTLSFTIDDTEGTRPLFLESGSKIMSFRESPEGSAAGKPFTVYVCNSSVGITGESEGAVMYVYSGTVRQEPVIGAHSG